MSRIIVGRVSSPFGERIHPITHKRSFHNGIDIACPIGTEVLSPTDGEVKQVYTNDKGGLTVILGCEGKRFGFCHLSKVFFPVGTKITKGSIVALSGNTGQSSGPHCHFTVMIDVVWEGKNNKGGHFVNPIDYMEL